MLEVDSGSAIEASIRQAFEKGQKADDGEANPYAKSYGGLSSASFQSDAFEAGRLGDELGLRRLLRDN